MMDKVEHALSLAARGFRVFPIAPNAKAPPLLNGWPKRATSDPEEVRGLWVAVPDANIGIECSGMIVIDVDVKKGGDESLQFLEITYELPATLVARTPTGGRHLFFRHNSSVGNTVGVLGSGLDIRSNGGYVVAAGSSLDAGLYAWEVDAPIADAPEWLVQKLGTFTKREHKVDNKSDKVVNAPEEVVNRARDWLASQLPAVEGLGGDAHTFKVICGLRDRGVSQSQAEELLQAWNVTCSPPWDENELAIKVSNAYFYAQNEPGARVALPNDFPVVAQIEQSSTIGNFEQPNSGTPIPKAGMKGHKLGQGGAKAAPYLIKGILSQRSYAMLYGASGEGKSFCALDIAYHVAAGLPWMGRKTRQGPVVYIPFEGEGGLHKREQALLRKYGDADVPMFVLPGNYNLREQSGARQFTADLAAVVAEHFAGKPPILFILDTLAHALRGADENSAQDISAFNSAVQGLITATGACVLVIHHSGKNRGAGARGSSALLAAVDTELGIESFQITAGKQRDDETGEAIGFKLVPATVGMDEDGDVIQSCVVEPATVVAESATRLTGNAARGFDVLCELAPDNSPVSPTRWKDACQGFLEKRGPQAFWDIKNNLKKKGYIEVDVKGYVTRSMI